MGYAEGRGASAHWVLHRPGTLYLIAAKLSRGQERPKCVCFQVRDASTRTTCGSHEEVPELKHYLLANENGLCNTSTCPNKDMQDRLAAR
jgi:hypothetical protein